MKSILLTVFALLANGFLLASPAFQHVIDIYLYVEGLDSDVEVEFLLNSPSRFDWRMHYDTADPLSYLHIRFPFSVHKYANEDGSYFNEFRIDQDVAHRRMLNIGTDSDAFLNADPVKQIQFLFAELKFRIGGVQYSLDLKNLTSEAVGYEDGWINGAFYTPITSITINKDFLETYCIIETSGG